MCLLFYTSLEHTISLTVSFTQAPDLKFCNICYPYNTTTQITFFDEAIIKCITDE